MYRSVWARCNPTHAGLREPRTGARRMGKSPSQVSSGSAVETSLMLTLPVLCAAPTGLMLKDKNTGASLRIASRCTSARYVCANTTCRQPA